MTMKRQKSDNSGITTELTIGKFPSPTYSIQKIVLRTEEIFHLKSFVFVSVN